MGYNLILPDKIYNLNDIPEHYLFNTACLDDPSHFKESLDIVNLSDSHAEKQRELEHGPDDHAPVGTVVYIAMCGISDLHIVLLLFHLPQLVAQITDHAWVDNCNTTG